MKLSKSQRSNLIFIIVFSIIFFTPLRGYIQVFVSQIKMSVFSPSIENVESRVKLANYNWNLKGINTEDFRFIDAKEKVILINFWATWCPPCRAEMLSFQKLYIDYKDDVVFLFLTNEESHIVKKYLDKKGFDLPSYNQYSNTPQEFQVSSIPATYIIDRKGSIVIDKVGPADWDSDKIRDLLNELMQN